MKSIDGYRDTQIDRLRRARTRYLVCSIISGCLAVAAGVAGYPMETLIAAAVLIIFVCAYADASGSLAEVRQRPPHLFVPRVRQPDVAAAKRST